MRNISFSENEFYHIYNRGVDKRNIFSDRQDVDRFFSGIEKFNSTELLGNLRVRHRVSDAEKLVDFVAYCINPNHFHFIIKQVSDKGIEKFMHKLGMGYAKYFNTRHKRSGALFQGKFRAKHVDSNEYLLHLSAYINLNHKAHSIRHRVSDVAMLGKTSWEEYVGNIQDGICKKEIILEQFKNSSAYKKFAEESLKSIVERKILIDELEEAGIEPIYTK